jgi:hypothetical protein
MDVYAINNQAWLKTTRFWRRHGDDDDDDENDDD